MQLPKISFNTYRLRYRDHLPREFYASPRHGYKYRAGYHFRWHSAFYHFMPDDGLESDPVPQAWKFRVSVNINDYPRALDLLLPLLMDAERYFKVVDPSLVLRDNPDEGARRFIHGSQFTIYPNEGIDSEETFRPLVEQIDKVLTDNHIRPGISDSDIFTFSRYVSVRNDVVNGEYIPVEYSGKNYDLENIGCPFSGLIPHFPAFDPVVYFNNFNIRRFDQFLVAFRFTILACIRPYIDIEETGIVIKEPYNKPSSEIYNDIVIALFIYHSVIPDNYFADQFSVKRTNYDEIANAIPELKSALEAIHGFIRTSPLVPDIQVRYPTLNEQLYVNIPSFCGTKSCLLRKYPAPVNQMRPEVIAENLLSTISKQARQEI